MRIGRTCLIPAWAFSAPMRPSRRSAPALVLPELHHRHRGKQDLAPPQPVTYMEARGGPATRPGRSIVSIRISIRCDCETIGPMLELAILGFLAEGALPGHELRRRVSHLTGYTRPVSDGSLYPAINRLAKAGLLERRADPQAGGARYVLSLTEAGRTEMLDRLRKPADHEITDHTRFYTVLSFLSLLPDAAERHAVL